MVVHRSITLIRGLLLGAIVSMGSGPALSASTSANCATFYGTSLPAAINGITFAVAGGATLMPDPLGRIEFAHNPITISFDAKDQAILLALLANVSGKNATVTGVSDKGSILFSDKSSVPVGGAIVRTDVARQLTLSADTDVWLSMVCVAE